jgi:hypothetical protein|tara:strand:+ start:353 stop:604 length:252 start_codon:yes stop_codon:yes gene_type:complete
MAIELKPKLDKIYIDIDGPNGNAFNLLGAASVLSKKYDFPGEMIRDEMASGDYMNLLKVFEDNFGEFVVLQTENAEYLEAFAK